MAIDELTYPAPVLNRQGPAASSLAAAAGALPAPPVTRIFPFSLKAAVSSRSTTFSPQLKGPSIIRSIHISKGGSGQGFQGFVLGKAQSQFLEVNVATSVPAPYTVLFEGLDKAGTTAGAPNEATHHLDLRNDVLSNDSDLGIIVLDRDWFLHISVTNATAGTPNDHGGYVVVLDQVSPQALANFL